MSVLRADSLRKSFKSRAVVDGVSLEVASGEVVGLLGPNGAGKTTCFYMIVGLVPADAGRIHLDGRELTPLPIHRRARLGISYLPQENSVFRKLSVEENVQAVLELQGLPPAAGPGAAHGAARRAQHLAPAQAHGAVALGRRAPPPRDRARARHQAGLHPARRAVRGRRPDRGARHPADHRLPQGARHRRADHRPQRARDPRHLRPRLHHQRRRGARLRAARRDCRQRQRASRLPGRAASACSGRLQLPP